jgi:predicted DNA-binding transcriptional regulator YafY
MTNTATRLLRLILLLQEQPNQKAEHLAQKLEVSVRTLHRYMSMLDEMGIPIYTERGPYGGFSLMRGYKMPPLIFSPQEAVALALGTQSTNQIWGELYHEASLSALSKLEHVLPDEQLREMRWAQQKLVSSGFQRLPIREMEPALICIRQALKENHKLHLEYQSAQAVQSSQRTVHPYHLLHHAGLWYLIAWCELRQSIRAFRLDRIRNLQDTAETFQPPQDFDVQQFINSGFLYQKIYTIRMRFEAEFAYLARNYSSTWDTLTEEADGSVTVDFSAPDLMMAASMVSSYGPSVQVIQPQELIRIVREWAAAVLSNYPV